MLSPHILSLLYSPLPFFTCLSSLPLSQILSPFRSLGTISESTASRVQRKVSSSLLCCQLLVAKMEDWIESKAALSNGHSDDYRNSLNSCLHSVFHLSLSLGNDAAAAHFLSRLLAAAFLGAPMGSVDGSEVLDRVVDSKQGGVKARNEFLLYCAATNCANVLHLLLSTYSLEWSVVSVENNVQEYVLSLLRETVMRGHAASAVVLFFHMHREGFELEGFFAETYIPSKTYVALQKMKGFLSELSHSS